MLKSLLMKLEALFRWEAAAKSAKIARADESHLDGIFEIEKECFSDPWSLDSLHYEITCPTSVCMVAMGVGGTVLGFVTMRCMLDEGHILNIAVASSARRQGIARQLMEELFIESGKLGVTCFTLEVRETNAGAIALYEELGFEVTGRRRNYYKLPAEDGLVMWRFP